MSKEMSLSLKGALADAYRLLTPYSGQYTVDAPRYLIMLEYIAGLPNARTKRILDLGTGIGILPLALRLAGYHANGIDYFIFPETDNTMFGRTAIDDLKRIWRSIGLIIDKQDITSSLPENLYQTTDIVTSDATIEHLKDPKTFLLNCYFLLASGGHLILSTPNLTTLLKRIRFLVGKSPHWPIAEFFKDGEKFTGHWREYTQEELSYMCTTVGFEVLQIKTRDVLTPWKRRGFKKNLRALIARLARLIPSAQEVHYVLARKS